MKGADLMNQFIPAFKGYERIGQFPLEKHSKFTSRKEAEEYARLGYTGESSAYPGQLISIQENDKITICTIDLSWNLSGITSTTTVDGSTYIEFTYEVLKTQSGANKFVIEEGSFLKTVTVQIIEPFCDNKGRVTDVAFTIDKCPYNSSYDEMEKLLGEEEMLTSEKDSSFIVYYNSLVDKKTNIIISANPSVECKTGRAILKIN